MKHLLSLIIAALFILVAYIYQFGTPGFLSFLPGLGQQSEQNSTAATKTQGLQGPAKRGGQQGARPGGRPAGGPGGAGPGRRFAGSATSVTLAEVVFSPYKDDYSAVGTGVAEQSVSLISETSGQITDINFDGTQMVKKGDVLLQLDSESERINVEIAEANLSKAQDALDRYMSLRKDLVADVTMKEAESAVAVAKGNLALAKATLNKKTIRAPIDGRLGLSELEIGDFLSNGAKVVEINNTQSILVEFELPERAIDILALGKKVEVTTPSKHGKVYKGVIDAFDSVVDTTTRTVTVRAKIDNSQGALWPGMTFTAMIEEQSSPLASVPSLSVVWQKTGTSVWIAENGKVHAVPVVLCKRIDETVWLEGALEAGMKVVVDGVQKVREGASIVDVSVPPAGKSGEGRAKQ